MDVMMTMASLVSCRDDDDDDDGDDDDDDDDVDNAGR